MNKQPSLGNTSYPNNHNQSKNLILVVTDANPSNNQWKPEMTTVLIKFGLEAIVSKNIRPLWIDIRSSSSNGQKTLITLIVLKYKPLKERKEIDIEYMEREGSRVKAASWSEFMGSCRREMCSNKYPTNIQKISNKYPLLDQSLWAAAVERCALTIIRNHFISDIYSFSLFKYLFLYLWIFQIRASTFQISIFCFQIYTFTFQISPFHFLSKISAYLSNIQ